MAAVTHTSLDLTTICFSGVKSNSLTTGFIKESIQQTQDVRYSPRVQFITINQTAQEARGGYRHHRWLLVLLSKNNGKSHVWTPTVWLLHISTATKKKRETEVGSFYFSLVWVVKSSSHITNTKKTLFHKHFFFVVGSLCKSTLRMSEFPVILEDVLIPAAQKHEISSAKAQNNIGS